MHAKQTIVQPMQNKRSSSNQGANLSVHCSGVNASRLAMNILLKQTSFLQLGIVEVVAGYISRNPPNQTEVGTRFLLLLTSSLQSYTLLYTDQKLTVLANRMCRKLHRKHYERIPCMPSSSG